MLLGALWKNKYMVTVALNESLYYFDESVGARPIRVLPVRLRVNLSLLSVCLSVCLSLSFPLFTCFSFHVRVARVISLFLLSSLHLSLFFCPIVL